MTARTMADKIWDEHAIGDDLLFIDLHLVHEVSSPQAFEGLRLAGRRVRSISIREFLGPRLKLKSFPRNSWKKVTTTKQLLPISAWPAL